MSNGNENIFTVSKVEGLLIEASKDLDKLIAKNNRQETMKQAAVEELHEYQTETLHALRILYEGD